MSSLADLITAGLYPDDHSLSLSDRMMMYFARVHAGEGTPEGSVVADVGSEYVDIETGTRYQKVSGSDNTGWVSTPNINEVIERFRSIPTGYVAGQLYGPQAAASTTRAMAVGSLRVSPYFCRNNQDFDRIQCETTTAGSSGCVYRLGIWNHDPDTGFPGTLFDDYGTVPGDAVAGVQFIEEEISLETGWYWLGIVGQVADGSAAVRGFTGSQAGGPLDITPTGSSSFGIAALAISGVTGALGSLVGASFSPTGVAAGVYLRAA